jgi:hypothetical protein
VGETPWRFKSSSRHQLHVSLKQQSLVTYMMSRP